MRARYAIAFGRGAHRHALRRFGPAAGLTRIVEHDQMLVLASADTPCLADEGSVLVGRLFSPAHEPVAALPPCAEGSAEPRRLLDRLDGRWGNFAWFGVAGDLFWAYREPSGSIPVYRLDADGGGLFVSDADTALQAGLLPVPVPDQTFLVYWLQFPFLRTRRAGLEQVSELLPGTMALRALAENWRCLTLWHPARFAGRAATVAAPEEAAAKLRAVALGAVAAQAGPGANVLRLSGGLDSSIIAACLAEAGVKFSCVNFRTRAADGDERDHARAVASHLHLSLREVAENDLTRIEPPANPGFRPRTNPLLLPFEQALGEAARDLGAQLLVDGSGGDNLFCYVTSAAPVVDALRRGRFRAAARTISDLAALADCTVWDALRAAARRAVRSRPTFKEDRSFLAREILLPVSEPHPWLHGLGHLPPGQREHVESLVHITHFLDRGSGDLPVLHPLMAQPLLELCLRIPSWLWVRGARDRAVARDAFAGRLPSSVLDRRDKGSMQSIFHRAFERLQGEMKDLLLTGELRRAGVLDVGALEAGFASDASAGDPFQLRISELVALELWLAAWRSLGPDSLRGAA